MIVKIKLYILFFLVCTKVIAQNSNPWVVNDNVKTDSLAYINNDIDILNNEKTLDYLFLKLQTIKQQKSSEKVSIVHIGDSHIQGNMMTDIIRTELQSYFGNSGRGLIFPYQLAKTNAPFEINSSSENIWKTCKITNAKTRKETGILGYSILPTSSCTSISMALDPKYLQDNQFDEISLFVKGKTSKINFSYKNSLDSIAIDSTSFCYKYKLKEPSNTIKLTLNTKKDSTYTFFGASVEKANTPGIIYHSIGVNGARFSDYNKSEVFWKQLESLKSDCYVFSMGTNEAQDQNLSMETFLIDLKETLAHIQKINPTAQVIISTPPVSYYKKAYPNKKLAEITTTIQNFCVDNNLVYWDLFNISKGLEGTKDWKTNQLLRPDLVHFSKEGYQLQGKLFISAFAKSWNNYILNKG